MIIVVSGLRIPSGATSGYVLTSDSSGNATWQAPTGGGGGSGGILDGGNATSTYTGAARLDMGRAT